MKKVLVIAAHPDDEVLGCGATMARHSLAGDEVHVVILAEGATSREQNRNRENHKGTLSELAHAAQQAREILGVATLTMYDYPDNRLDSIDLLDVVKTIETHIVRCRPDIVYTHHGGDVNVDHRRIHEAVITACRPQPGHPVKQLLFFEVPSSTEWQPPGSAPPFAPNYFVCISEQLPLKLSALEAYSTELREWPHPRSLQAVEHLSRWRGSCAGLTAAEAFIIGRSILN